VVIGILLAFRAGSIYVGHYGWKVVMPPWRWLMIRLGIFFGGVQSGNGADAALIKTLALYPKTLGRFVLHRC
jgi:hypothetical protein